MAKDLMEMRGIVMETVSRVLLMGEDEDPEVLTEAFNRVPETAGFSGLAGCACAMVYAVVQYCALHSGRDPQELWREIAVFLEEDAYGKEKG